MTLWIRSQDRQELIKANEINAYQYDEMAGLGNDWHIFVRDYEVGVYKTKERALEVLDEIQNKLQNKFLCKPNCLMKAKDIDREELYLNNMYKGEFIMQPTTIDIEPINCDVVIYEMPSK